MTSRGARAARGATIVVFATFVASLAHTVGGGAAPGPVAVLLALAFSLPLAMLLAGARARIVRTSISALVTQAALHLFYAMGGASVATSNVTSPHVGHGGDVTIDMTFAVPVVDHGGALMPFAHLVAAGLTVAALALGDEVFDTVQRSVLLFVRRLTSRPEPISARPVRVAAEADRPRLIGTMLLGTLWSRGPPVVGAAS